MIVTWRIQKLRSPWVVNPTWNECGCLQKTLALLLRSSFILSHELATFCSIRDSLFFFLLSSKIKTNRRDRMVISTRKMWVWEVWEIGLGLELVLPWRTGNHSMSGWPESTPKILSKTYRPGVGEQYSAKWVQSSLTHVCAISQKNIPLPRGPASFSQDIILPVRTTGAASNTSWQLQEILVVVLIPLSFPSVCRWFKFDPSGGKKSILPRSNYYACRFLFLKKMTRLWLAGAL